MEVNIDNYQQISACCHEQTSFGSHLANNAAGNNKMYQ